jgi:hypothetical protein
MKQPAIESPATTLQNLMRQSEQILQGAPATPPAPPALPKPAAPAPGMSVAFCLLKFCSENRCALLTKTERENLARADGEIDRVSLHLTQFAAGLAKRKLDAARNAYTVTPSEINRAALDKIRATWLAEDAENAAQRSIIRNALTALVTREFKIFLPPIIRRAAAALAALAAKVQLEEQTTHALYGAPYRPSAIVDGLLHMVTTLKMSAAQIDSPAWTWTSRSTGVSGCGWIQEVAAVKGDPWIEPAAAAAPERGTALKTYSPDSFLGYAGPG